MLKKKSDNMKSYKEERKKVWRRNSCSHLSEIMIIYILVNILPSVCFFSVHMNKHILNRRMLYIFLTQLKKFAA